MNVVPTSEGRRAHVVQSARNGLLVTIPTDARGVVPRFFTKGDNELVFKRVGRQQTKVDVAPAVLNAADEGAVGGDSTLHVDTSEQPTKKKSRSKLEDLA